MYDNVDLTYENDYNWKVVRKHLKMYMSVLIFIPLDAPHEWNDNCVWEENNWNDYSKKNAFIQVIKHSLLT